MRKAGGLTRAPNETASVKQPKLAGFLITQHHFAPWHIPIGRPTIEDNAWATFMANAARCNSSDKSSCVTENTVQPAAARRDSLF